MQDETTNLPDETDASRFRSRKLAPALVRVLDYLTSTQKADGTWSGLIESDPRVTAFYLSTIFHLGRGPDNITRAMERYLYVKQLSCGAWEVWPGSGPDINVTMFCVFALKIADTDAGRQSKLMAERWLSSQSVPEADLFWRGYLALNGELDWGDLPYFTPRLITNPRWLHPNIYDFSFIRVIIVALGLLQSHLSNADRSQLMAKDMDADGSSLPEFLDWKRRWITEARKPLNGLVPALCKMMKMVDSILPIDNHKQCAIKWLLDHQEENGAFFSAAQTTSMCILTLHKLDASRYQPQIEAGLGAMKAWQIEDGTGRRQQFADGTVWDTAFCLDLLRNLDVPSDDDRVRMARDFIVERQNTYEGDWSHRFLHRVTPGGWAFQRVGQFYPDNDDTAVSATVLLDLGGDDMPGIVGKAARWLLALQCSNGGWASWDRNDRSWIRFPGAGQWFARDLACPEITARVLILLNRVVRGGYPGHEDLVRPARQAIKRGLHWLERQRKDGVWLGVWLTHYLYGTCHVLEAYKELGVVQNDRMYQLTLDWLVRAANADGGYGEAPDSYRTGAFERAPSTSFHTGCALLAFVHAGASDHPAARRAADWLHDNQKPDGSWSDDIFFAAGVPGLWYASFSLMPTVYAAKALLRFRTANASNAENRINHAYE